MTENELLKIASKHPPLPDEQMSDDMNEAGIDEMCDDAWLRFSKLAADAMEQIMGKVTTK